MCIGRMQFRSADLSILIHYAYTRLCSFILQVSAQYSMFPHQVGSIHPPSTLCCLPPSVLRFAFISLPPHHSTAGADVFCERTHSERRPTPSFDRTKTLHREGQQQAAKGDNWTVRQTRDNWKYGGTGRRGRCLKRSTTQMRRRY